MPFGRFRSPRRSAAFRLGALSAFLALAVSNAAAAETVRLRYALTLIGLPLGVAEAKADLEPSRYSIEAEAKLTGIASLIASAKGAAKASGSILKGRVAPADYATTSADTHMTRTVRMAMDQGSVRAVDIEPPMRDLPGRIPVTDDLKRNIVDPLSALIMTVPKNAPLVGPAACDRTIPVYDGYERFNIKLAFVQERAFAFHGYSGQVSVCAARYVPIAGHRPNRPGTKFMEDNRQLAVWLAPLASARVELPVRISVATMIGTTVIEATDFSEQGAPIGSEAPSR